MSHLVIHSIDLFKSTDSFRKNTHTQKNKWLSIRASHSILQANDSLQGSDSFGNETTALFVADSELKQVNRWTFIFMSEWVIQTFTQTICSKAMIHSEMKQQHSLLLILFWLHLVCFYWWSRNGQSNWQYCLWNVSYWVLTYYLLSCCIKSIPHLHFLHTRMKWAY